MRSWVYWVAVTAIGCGGSVGSGNSDARGTGGEGGGGAEAGAEGGNEDTPGSGEDGGDCYPNSTCNDGLTCVSNLCVRPVADAGAGGSGPYEPDASTGGTMNTGAMPNTGGGMATGGASGAGDAGPACVDIGDFCDVSPCCVGTCVNDFDNPSVAICAPDCLTHSQCQTGCCFVLVQGGGFAVCAPANQCAP